MEDIFKIKCITCVTSSDANCFNKVVFPALSNPNNKILTSRSGVVLSFLSNDNKPCRENLNCS